MLSLKYIRIRKDRPVEQRLSSIWREACADFGIPCVLIYLDGDCAYISASLKHLRNLSLPEPGLQQLQEKLIQTQLQFAGARKGYWKHSDYYHTFDGIPQATAKEAASNIFAVLSEYLNAGQLPAKKSESSASQPAPEENAV